MVDGGVVASIEAEPALADRGGVGFWYATWGVVLMPKSGFWLFGARAALAAVRRRAATPAGPGRTNEFSGPRQPTG